ncbi:MAG: hypothetical protein AB7P40_00440 [Chloroflexota bacterium]
MADCPEREGTSQGHCWHPMTMPYQVAKPGGTLAPAIGECCCHCGAAHVKILMARPENADGHGEYLVFQEPKQQPVSVLVPHGSRVLH